MASWGFLKDGAGILPASNMADPLQSTSLQETEVLVREAVQNSLDERRLDVDRPVRVRFERTVLVGDAKQRFVDGLKLDELSSRAGNFKASHNWFGRGASVLDAIDDAEVSLPVLTISDFNANGLGGRWNRRGSKEDRFFNLVLSIGGSLKWEEEEESTGPVRSLGSYGYGKMAFAMCSDIRTIVYYSTFRPDEGSADVSCRAMASGFLPPHSVEGVDYVGQAYFGCDSSEERFPRRPFDDDDAHAWIRTLGLPLRSDSETGTTVVIPAAGSTMQEIVRCCETWWWPRMREPEPVRRVRFEFIDEGVKMNGCNLRSRPDLSPFIDCYKLVTARAAGDGYEFRDVEVRPGGFPRGAGRLVLKASRLPSPRNAENGHDRFHNCVALVRDGLVIKYENQFAHEDKVPVAGVFVPDEDPETLQAFVFSEPPSHDEWEENAGRLQGKYAWGREFLRLTKNRLRNLTRDFQTRQAPLPDSERSDVDGFLRRALGDLFRPPISKTPNSEPRKPPSPRSRAFTIATRESGRRRQVDESGVHHEDFATFRIGLAQHAQVETADVDVMIDLKALVDVDGKAADPIQCEVTGPGELHEEETDRTRLRTTLRCNEEVDVSARGRVHPRWKTEWQITIRKTEE